MENFKQNPHFASLKFALLTYFLVIASVKAQVNGQVATPCTASMIATFTPCMNYITGSTADGSSPSSNCCGALKSVMSSSMNCACLLVTSSIPLPQLVNRTLALGLPRICKNAGVPLQCEASSSPLPAPGPQQFGATTPGATPSLSPGFSPQASKATVFTPASKATTPPEVAPSSSGDVEAEAPSRTPRVRPVFTPTTSSASMIPTSTTIMAFLSGFMLFNLCVTYTSVFVSN